MPISPDKKPISFSFNNTERCQSRCITCNGWKTPAEVMQQELTLDEWKQILTNLHNWMGNYQFIISGGEPFIRDDVFEMAEFATSLGDTVNIVTNGLALPDKLEKVLYSAFNNITFSLNSVADPKIHNISRGRDDAFQRTMDALQNLNYMNKHRTGHKWKNIYLSTVVMPTNLSEIRPIAEFCQTEGIGVSYQLMDNGDAFSTAVDSDSQIYGTDVKSAALKAIDEKYNPKEETIQSIRKFENDQSIIKDLTNEQIKELIEYYQEKNKELTREYEYKRIKFNNLAKKLIDAHEKANK